MANITRHNITLSVGKALCIILMVIAHAPAPSAFIKWILLFHMPFFFFVSGMCFKETYLKKPFDYFKRRFKGYYIPFVKWTLMFILLHNILAKYGICYGTYQWNHYSEKIVRALLLSGSEQLLGGYWFLIEGFFSALITFAIIWCIDCLLRYKRFKNKTVWNNLYLCGAIISCTFGAALLGESKILFKINSVTLLATAFILAGFLYRIKNIRIPARLGIAILSICGVAAVIGNWFFWMQMKGPQILIYMPVAVLCSVSVLSICEHLAKNKRLQWLDYIGVNTLTILTFHFLAFKLVSLYIIQRDNLSMDRLADFPAIGGAGTHDWILYTIVGVALPLVGKEITERFKQYICDLQPLTYLIRR